MWNGLQNRREEPGVYGVIKIQMLKYQTLEVYLKLCGFSIAMKFVILQKQKCSHLIYFANFAGLSKVLSKLL